MGPVTKNRANQHTFALIEERSIHAQKIAIPQKRTTIAGIDITTNAKNRSPAGSLAQDEVFKDCRIDGITINSANTQRLENTAAEPKNTAATALDSSQLDLILNLGCSLLLDCG